MSELYHYGVLGMHWHVRKFKPVSTSNDRPKSKTRIGWDDDIRVKKGTRAYRITPNTSEKTNLRYVTVDENDRLFYKAMWEKTLKDNGIANKDSKFYEQRYKLKSDLLSPSAKKRLDIANDLMNDKDVYNEFLHVHVVHQMAQKTGQSIPYTKALIKNTKDTKKYNAAYKHAIGTWDKYWKEQFKNGPPTMKGQFLLQTIGESDYMRYKFGEAVVKRGYNMVIDDHGADFKNDKVNAPIILLKANSILEEHGSKPLSQYTENSARYIYLNDTSEISTNYAKKHYVPKVYN